MMNSEIIVFCDEYSQEIKNYYSRACKSIQEDSLSTVLMQRRAINSYDHGVQEINADIIRVSVIIYASRINI